MESTEQFFAIVQPSTGTYYGIGTSIEAAVEDANRDNGWTEGDEDYLDPETVEAAKRASLLEQSDLHWVEVSKALYEKIKTGGGEVRGVTQKTRGFHCLDSEV